MDKVQCNLIEDLPMDLQAPWNSFCINALGPIQMVEYLLPLLDKGKMKRLCFVSSEVACIALMKYRSEYCYPYPMSKSSMNMGVRLMHNLLFPQGYTFRLYHPGWMKQVQLDGTYTEKGLFDPANTAVHAAKYFETPLGDEYRLVMYDFLDQEWPF
jgi:NAD(P)-dependent dehydrogenase (short-subunit alcohol dehydrogenase family)